MNESPDPKARYEEFQLFGQLLGPEFVLILNPLTDKRPPIPPDKVGIDWGKVDLVLRTAMQALQKGTDYEFGGVEVLPNPKSWEYHLPSN